MIRLKRVYEAARPADGKRFLVERLWPRGMKKDALRLDGWLPEVAPAPALRKWFHHDAARWAEFQERYRAELDARPDAWAILLEAARKDTVTLLFSARDVEHNNAVALKLYLEAKLRRITSRLAPFHVVERGERLRCGGSRCRVAACCAPTCPVAADGVGPVSETSRPAPGR